MNYYINNSQRVTAFFIIANSNTMFYYIVAELSDEMYFLLAILFYKKDMYKRRENYDTVFIYALYSTEGIRYIGQTYSLSRRYREHLRSKKKNHLSYWISKCRNSGDQVNIMLLAIANKNNYQNLEKYFIQKYKVNDRLINKTDGGEGCNGYTMSDERKKKLSEIRKRLIEKNPELRDVFKEINEKRKLGLIKFNYKLPSRELLSQIAKERFANGNGAFNLDNRIKAVYNKQLKHPAIIQHIKSKKILRFFSPKKCAEYLGISPMSFYQYRSRNKPILGEWKIL